MISVAVMAHPKRKRYMRYLLDRLPADTPVIWDRLNDRWDTGRRSMLAFDPLATHHLVVQDDALLCRDLVDGAERAVAVVPSNPISFYTGKVRPNHAYVEQMVKQARKARRSWIAMQGPWWGVAVLIPTQFIPEMIAWCDQRADIANYDMRMSRYFDHIGVQCYYSVPSLVSHRTGPENPSLVPGRGNAPSRTAFEFIGEQRSALEVDWTAAPVLAQPWRKGEYEGITYYWCQHNGCHYDSPSERSMRQHFVQQHDGTFRGPVDFLAGSPEAIARMQPIWAALPSKLRGRFYVLTLQFERFIEVEHESVRKAQAEKLLTQASHERLVVTGAERELDYVGPRPALVLPDGSPGEVARWLDRHTYLTRATVAA